MHHSPFFTTIALALSAALPSSSAAPVQSTVFQQYNLRTSHATHKRHNDLYLQSWHVVAGLAVATFTNSTTDAEVGYLNGTVAQFNAGGGSEYTEYMVMGGATSDEWQAVNLNLGPFGSDPNNVVGQWNDFISENAFSIDEKLGLQYRTATNVSDQNSFAGWLVCDWVMGSPQLYWKDHGNETEYFTPGCSDVRLIPEYI